MIRVKQFLGETENSTGKLWKSFLVKNPRKIKFWKEFSKMNPQHIEVTTHFKEVVL